MFQNEFFGLTRSASELEPRIGTVNEAGECVLRDLTQAEQDVIQAILDADYTQEILAELRQSIRTQAEDVFCGLAEIVTGEHITEMTLAEWAKKEEIALAWEQAGKPEPAQDNEYYWAYSEAQGDPVKTPWELLDKQLANAKAWRGMQIGFSVWRQAFRARVKAAYTEADLNTLRASIEPELKNLLGV